MRLLFMLIILLAFPVLEIWLLIELGSRYGWWLLAYLVSMAILGWRLILEEKFLLFGRVAQTLAQGNTPLKALFESAKNLIAGVLLILPGVMSDVIALVILFMPTAKLKTDEPKMDETKADKQSGPATQKGEYDVIEGEFHREE